MQSKTEEKIKTQKSLFEWAQTICIALIAITVIYTFLGRMVNVEGHSMENTLTHGERLLLSSMPYTPEHGDIVVISRGEEKTPLIKRVIGLPGDTIRIDETTGQVYRNGELLTEPYVVGETATEKMTGEITVPEGMLFVMGDNRASGCSLDSRTFGCIAQDDVVGKTVFRLLPLQRMGDLYDDEY